MSKRPASDLVIFRGGESKHKCGAAEGGLFRKEKGNLGMRKERPLEWARVIRRFKGGGGGDGTTIRNSWLSG